MYIGNLTKKANIDNKIIIIFIFILDDTTGKKYIDLLQLSKIIFKITSSKGNEANNM